MIEYGLLFALGFFAALLLVALISPAIQRRVVVYTENRLRLTTPLSADEVRAQKDMVRAVHAAENARLAHALKREREDKVALKVAADQAIAEMRRALRDEQSHLDQINAMSTEAAQLRADAREAARREQHLKSVLDRSEATIVERDLQIEALLRSGEAGEKDKTALAREVMHRETEIQDLRLRLNALRQERDEQQAVVKAADARAQKAEQRLMQEEDKVLRLEERLEKLTQPLHGAKGEAR
ncbi:hypothetical protein ACQ3G6_01655 [Allorhizobium undicola]|uniref:hypothetical protein n=1 Tax=Allorhizobium undicola TaxID=78527 RepID=UPI003D34CAD8